MDQWENNSVVATPVASLSSLLPNTSMNVEDDELPMLPRMPSDNSPKRVRRRARFSNDTVAASTLVAGPSPDLVISTLIDSLTAISHHARDQLKREFNADAVRPSHSPDTQDLLPQDSFFVDIPVHRRLIPVPNEDYDDGDGDVAAAPVVRFNRGPPEPKSKESKTDRSGSYLTAMASDPSLSVRNSLQSLHSEGAPGSIGVLSIGRPRDSSTSQAASLRSARSLSRNESEPAQQPSPQDLVLPRRSNTSTSKHDWVTARFSFEPEDDRHHWKIDTDSASRSDSPSASQGEHNESHTNSPLNAALGRGDLGNHLIPTRRSSRKSDSRSDFGEGYRHSTGGSRDLKDLNIDEDLIGSDDSTVRRIRELQEAREKRQSEWRKESRRSFDRSDRAGKRHSAPSPKAIHKTNTYQSSKLSVTEVLVESEQEASPDISARIDASDLASMPALIVPDTDDGPVSLASPTRAPQPPRSSQTTPTPTARALSAPLKTTRHQVLGL